LRKVQT
ncbi:bacterial extracellular solute-binding s, 3 family protein, partial [Vibrio parahaemolyticus V-223/04]